MATYVNNRRDMPDLEEGIKNKFKFEWLTLKDINGDFLSDYIRKVVDPGMAFCIHCNDYIKYASSGKSSFIKHARTQKHQKMRNLKIGNQQLPASYVQPCDYGSGKTGGGNNGGGDSGGSSSNNIDGSKPGPHSSLPYGVAENVTGTSSENRRMPSKPNISIADRKSNLEALFLSFTAEHGLPLSLVPDLVKLSQESSRDTFALNSLTMERTSASYKLTDGIQLALKKKLVSDLQKAHFSFNLDECTSTANEKILTILVCYFSEEQGESVVLHYDSLSLTTVNAKTVLQSVLDRLTADNISLDNLVSVLSDSAAYMRGSKGGFETLLRQQAPHLLDIGGDVCHHIHNIVRNFCKHFGGYVEKLDDDIHNDFKWSPDLKDYLREICCALDEKFLTPKQRVPHRWLSAYDATVPNVQMFNALTLFYWTWLPDKEKENYDEIIQVILKDVSPMARQLICNVQQNCLAKNLTEDGKQKKMRIVEKVFFKRDKTTLLMSFYVEFLPKFKEFILKFEQKQPMIHKLYDEQQALLKWFLSCFMKFEELLQRSNKLVKLDIRDPLLLLKENDMFVGQKTKTILKTIPQKSTTRKEFMETLKKAYIETGVYMQEKLKSSTAVRALSAIDPKAMGHTMTYRELEKLKDLLPNILNEDQLSDYAKEIRDIQMDESLPSVHDAQGNAIRLDHWWAALFSQNKYPSLSLLVKACLSIFTAPQVEQSFSGMNDIINPKTNRLEVKTFAAIQSLRYALKAKHKSSLQLFHRADVRKDPVDHLIAKHLQTSHKTYVARLNAIAKAKLEKARSFALSSKQKKSTNHQQGKIQQKKPGGTPSTTVCKKKVQKRKAIPHQKGERQGKRSKPS